MSSDLLAAGQLLARWQRAGASFHALDYLEALRPLDQTGRLVRLLDLADRDGVVRDETFAGVALAAREDTPNWQKQVLYFLLLPLLKERLRGGRRISALVAAWEAEPLAIKLD